MNKQQIHNVVREYAERFGRQPEWVVMAPGRVNLIGEHTDYNDGFVLPMAIERYTVIAAGRQGNAGDNINALSLNLGELESFAAGHLQPEGTWADYAKGVLAQFIERGLRPQSLDVLVGSDVPMGCGLSSSAALQVATARLLQCIAPGIVSDDAIAALCQDAEHRFAGVPVGIMDPYCISRARQQHAVFLDCRSEQAKHIRFDDPDIVVMIVDSKVSRKLRSGEYATRRAQCEEACRVLGVNALRDADVAGVEQARPQLGDICFRRARHVTTENARTRAAAAAMQVTDWRQFGELMYASHQSLRYDFEVSCAELDMLVDSLNGMGPARGILGARMTGGGFGGCAVALVLREKADEISAELTAAYAAATDKQLTSFVSSPAQGAQVVGQHEWEAA